MILISFWTQDSNIKTGTVRNPLQNSQLIHDPLYFQNPRIRSIYHKNPKSVRFLRPNPSIRKPIPPPPRGTRKAILLSECNADIPPHLSTDHLAKCGDFTAELIMTSQCGYWWDVGDTTHTHYHLPKAETLAWKILPGTKVMPGLAEKHVINFQKCQMTVEICFPLGKTIILLLSDRVSDISFAGVGLFFSES